MIDESILCKCVTFIYHLEWLLSWFVFFKPILEWLFSDSQFLTLHYCYRCYTHSIFPSAPGVLTLRPLLLLSLVLMYIFFGLSLEKPDFQHFVPKSCWVRLRQCWGFVWHTKVSSFALLTVVSFHPLIPEGEVSDSVARWAIYDS